MSIYNDFHVSHNHERKLKQIEGESELHYKMILDYIIFRNIPELVYKYKCNTKNVYDIIEKYNWKERVAKYDIACDKAYMKEIFTEIIALNHKKRENLFSLAKNIQDQILNFQAYILVDPKHLMQKGKPSQQDIINIVRQSTRAMLDLQKLSKIINEELKAIGIDLSPAFQKKFEQEEILGKCLLEQEEETDEITKSIFIQSGDYINQIKEEQAKANTLVLEPSTSVVEPSSSVAEPVETPENTSSASVVEPAEVPETKAPYPLTQIQKYIEQTNKQLIEMGVDSSSVLEPNSSLVEPVETPEDEDDEEELYDEFAPENHRYPFPMEYLIPINEREVKSKE